MIFFHLTMSNDIISLDISNELHRPKRTRAKGRNYSQT